MPLSCHRLILDVVPATVACDGHRCTRVGSYLSASPHAPGVACASSDALCRLMGCQAASVADDDDDDTDSHCRDDDDTAM